MNESLITRDEDTGQGQSVVADTQKSEDATSVEDSTTVESTSPTNLMHEEDTSDKSSQIDWEKRYKDLQSFQSKRENELKKQLQELDGEKGFVPPTTPEEMEEFKKSNPDMYNTMLTLAHQTVTEATQDINSHLEVVSKEKKMAELQEKREVIKRAHPDFSDIIKSKGFKVWADGQPRQVQDWIYNNPDDPELAIIALDRYKASRDATPAHPEPQQDTRSAAEPIGNGNIPQMTGGVKYWTESEIKSLTGSAWSENEPDIMKAYREGRVIKG